MPLTSCLLGCRKRLNLAQTALIPSDNAPSRQPTQIEASLCQGGSFRGFGARLVGLPCSAGRVGSSVVVGSGK